MYIVYKHFRYTPEGALRHYQRGKNDEGESLCDWKPQPRGGQTTCYIYEDSEIVASGEAHCSLQDSFCYHIGRDISRGRALLALKVKRGEVYRKFPKFAMVHP